MIAALSLLLISFWASAVGMISSKVRKITSMNYAFCNYGIIIIFLFPDMAYVAVASQTAGAVNVAEAMSSLLLQRILGSGPSVKYGLGSGLLAQAAASVGGNSAASGVCQMYSDAGLIGALVVSEAASAGENL